MNNTVWYVLVIITFHLLCSCSNSNDNHEVNFLMLRGHNFTLKVNRISAHPNVQLPSDQLEESDYEEIVNGSEYEVSFSEDMQTISIMPDSIAGTIIEDAEQYKKYDLDKGLMAGGRFVVWIANGKFEAEYTVYGSGVPIARSERGYLFF